MEPEPTNEHERAIAKIIEARCQRNDCSYPGGLLEVSSTVDFLLSEPDIKYLIALMKKNCLPLTQFSDTIKS
jgi:hypothetical protein